jgi:hypothetical protein
MRNFDMLISIFTKEVFVAREYRHDCGAVPPSIGDGDVLTFSIPPSLDMNLRPP